MAKVIAASARKVDDIITTNDSSATPESKKEDAKQPEKLIITLPSKAPKEILVRIKEILKDYPAENGPGLAVYLRLPRNGDFDEIKTKATVAMKSALTRQLKELVVDGKIELV